MSEEKKRYWEMVRDLDGPDLIRFGHKEKWSSEQWQKVAEFRSKYRRRTILEETLRVFPGARIIS